MSVQFRGGGLGGKAAAKALPFALLAGAGCARPSATSHAELAFRVPLGQAPAAAATRSADGLETDLDPTATPAYRYAQLDRDACEAELTRRGIGWTDAGESRGVLAPVRLTGPVGGVTYHSTLSPSQRATSPNEVFDCRLVLSLDDFSAILTAHDVVEVIHLSAWRPPRARSWPAGKLGTRHEGGLALDAGIFVRRDGSRLNVEKDFHGRIGARTCGPGTGPKPATPEAVELRSIACEAADAHLFQVELTPDYNWPHRNHFHLEVTPTVKWFLVH
jgi:hypothetical protein